MHQANMQNSLGPMLQRPPSNRDILHNHWLLFQPILTPLPLLHADDGKTAYCFVVVVSEFIPGGGRVLPCLVAAGVYAGFVVGAASLGFCGVDED